MASFSGLPYLYKEGTLIKRQRAQHHKANGKLKFQERYFQLKGDSFDYYDPKKKLSGPSKGSFQMRRAKIVEGMPYGVFKKSYMFQVGDNTEVLYLVATSEFEMDSWLKALRQCCEDCNNNMFTKFHPGVYGLTAKNHWSCCGSPRETGGCSDCHQPSKPASDKKESPKLKAPSKNKPPDKVVTSNPVLPITDASTPEPHVMYINPLREHPSTTDTAKVLDSGEANSKKRQSGISLDSGNGTGSTNSSRPQSQVIIDPHGTPGSSDSPQIKPSSDKTTTKEDGQSLNKIPEKKREDSSAIKGEHSKETSGTNLLRDSTDLLASSGDATDAPTDTTNVKPDTGTTSNRLKDTTSDTPKDTTSDTPKDTTNDRLKDHTSNIVTNNTSDTAKDGAGGTNSDVTKAMTSDTAKDTTTDRIKDTVNNLDTRQSEVVAKGMDAIGDITNSTVTDKAWLTSSKPDAMATTSADKQDSNEEKQSESTNAKGSNVSNLNIKDSFDEVDTDDVFASELPSHFRKSHLAPSSPLSPSNSPRLDSKYSPASMSPRPRRSSFGWVCYDCEANVSITTTRSVSKVLIKSKQSSSSNPMNTNKDGYTQLHLACKNGDITAIQSEIDLGADVEMDTISSTNSLKPIFLAFLHDHNQALEYLLVNCGANPSSTDTNTGATLLHWASQRGNAAIVQLLIQNEAEVDKTDWKGNTPLFEAAKNGHTHILDILIKCGADVNITNVNKRTALHEAAQFGFYDVAKLLLDHKANPDVRETITNNTPAELASLHKHQKVYNLLVPSSEEDGAPYESLHVIPGAYPEGIAGVSFCDGNVLVTGSKDHQVGFWDVPGAECKRNVQLDNTILSVATHGTFVAIGSTQIRLLSSKSEAWRRSVIDTDLDYEAIEEDLALHVVGFTPNGRLVTADVEDEDALIKLWPVLDENLHLKTCQRYFCTAVDKRSTTYTMVVCSVPESTVLAVVIQPGSLFNPKGNKLIRVYDWKTCKCLQTIDTGYGGFDVAVVIRFSTVKPNELAVACQNSIKVYNTDTAEVVASFSSTNGAMVTSLAYSANGQHLCAGLESGTIQVFNLSSKAQQFALETQTSSISCMEFSPDGHFLAVGTSDGNIELWKTNSSKT